MSMDTLKHIQRNQMQYETIPNANISAVTVTVPRIERPREVQRLQYGTEAHHSLCHVYQYYL